VSGVLDFHFYSPSKTTILFEANETEIETGTAVDAEYVRKQERRKRRERTEPSGLTPLGERRALELEGEETTISSSSKSSITGGEGGEDGGASSIAEGGS
jgi:hypothetical protein